MIDRRRRGDGETGGRRDGFARRISRGVVAGAMAAMLLAPAARAGDMAYGEYLSGECVTCHRLDGADKGIPPIVGWPEDQFVAVLMSYKEKLRDSPVMQTIAGRLGDEEIASLAAFFATQQPK